MAGATAAERSQLAGAQRSGAAWMSDLAANLHDSSAAETGYARISSRASVVPRTQGLCTGSPNSAACGDAIGAGSAQNTRVGANRRGDFVLHRLENCGLHRPLGLEKSQRQPQMRLVEQRPGGPSIPTQ